MHGWLDFPTTREAPEHVLQGLAVVDPSVRLMWWGLRGFEAKNSGGGAATLWRPAWLVYQPSPAQGWLRERAGERLRAYSDAPLEKRDPQRIRLWLLRYQGFRPVLWVPVRDADSVIVQDFTAADYLDRCRRSLTRAAEEAMLAEMESQDEARLLEREEKMREAVAATMKDIYRYLWRGRRSVLVN